MTSNDPRHAHGLVVDVLSLIQDVKRVPCLQARKIHGPSVDIRHGQGECRWSTCFFEIDIQAVVNDAFDAVRLCLGWIRPEPYPKCICETEDGKLPGISLVHEPTCRGVVAVSDPPVSTASDFPDVIGRSR